MESSRKTPAIFDIFQKTGVRWTTFIWPSFFSLLAGLAEGLNILLLLPLCRGLVQGNYGFFRTEHWFEVLAGYLPVAHFSNSVLFAMLILAIFISAGAKAFFEYLSGILISREIRQFANKLRQILFSRFISFGKLFFDQNSFGVIQQNLLGSTARVSYDLKSYQQAFTWIVQLVIYLIAMWCISWPLMLTALLIFPLFHFSAEKIIHKMRSASVDYAQAANDLSKKAFNVFSSVVLTKSYHMEESEKKIFSVMSDHQAACEYRIDKKENLIAPIQEMILLSVMLVMVGTIALFASMRKGDFSSALVFFYVLKRSSNHFKSLNNVRSAYAASSGLWKNLSDILTDKDKFFVRDGDHPYSSLQKGIFIKKLHFDYPTRPNVLKDCSFEIERGKMTAFVGHTGAGKTTVVNLLCRFYQAPPASIFIDDTDINQFSLESFYQHMAYVGQDVQLINDSFRANLLYGLDPAKISDEQILQALKKARLEDLVLSLNRGMETPLEERGIRRLDRGLDTPIGDRGVRLSGGEKQRLSLARAILKNAEILVLDEATSALDTTTEKLIQESIDEAAKGRTTIVIAHRLSTVRHADKIIVFEKGEIAEAGTLQELLDKKGKFYEFWQAQRFE